MTDNAQEIFQKIGQEAVTQIVEDWQKLEILAEIDEEMCLFDAWYLTSDEQKKMLTVSFELSDLFEDLRGLESMSKKGQWNKCTFTLHSNGKYETNFNYDEKQRWHE
jgi:hypothetical protein